MKTYLYKKDSSERIRQWSIRADDKGIYTADGILGGKIKDETFKEAKPTNIGKANYRDSKAQALFMMEAAITKKLRSNYFKSVEEAKNKEKLFLPTGCPGGMCWEKFKDKSHVIYPALASAKLDGSKMYSTWRENRVFLNTRSAKEHLNFQHIEEALKDFYKENPNIVLDGEAYNHDYAKKFEELQSIFRKEKPTEEQRKLSKEVAKFYVYDVVDLNKPNLTAIERQTLLQTIFDDWFDNSDFIIEWSSIMVTNEKDYDKFHEKCMKEGFEGSILKISDQPYIQRKTKFVMKRKPKFDCEFKIIDVLEGTGTNKGIAASIVIDLKNCEGMNHDHFSQLKGEIQDAGFAKGWNHKLQKELLLNKNNIVGKYGTIEYGGITNHGKLRFPKFKAVRKI